ncbi:MAG: hypothetical protein U9O06_13295 [Euryarchaeota archaeon]|nr:hypothetical protein [Euryarchaeota archaeon]
MKRVGLLVGLLAVVCLAGPAIASSPPEPVCGPCGSSFEEVAGQQGVPVNVTHSTAEIRVDENGSATWVVRNRLNESTASRLAANPERLTLIAREAAVGDGVAAGSGESIGLQSATVDNETAQIRFHDPDAGSHHAGVLVVDYFHSGGSWGLVLNADRVSISGPEGAVVANDPRSIIDDEYATDSELPTVSEGTVTWQRTAATEDRAELYHEFYIAYAEPGTGSTRVDAALTLASLPTWLSNVRDIVLPGAVVYGLVLIGIAAVVRWTVWTPTEADLLRSDVDPLLFDTDRLPTDVNWFAAGVTGIGLAVGLLAALRVLPATLFGVGVIYLGTGAAAIGRPNWLRSARGALAVGLAATLAVGGLLPGLGTGNPRFTGLVPTVIHAMAIHLPFAVAPTFGLAVDGDGFDVTRSAVAALCGAVAAFVVAGGAFVPFDSRPSFLILFVLPVIIGVVGVLMLPLSLLAASLSDPDDPPEKATRSPSETTETVDSETRSH